jgi:succinate-semialdehyde dehydrogenase/glutarate-semialdehyde dehydrogenase
MNCEAIAEVAAAVAALRSGGTGTTGVVGRGRRRIAPARRICRNHRPGPDGRGDGGRQAEPEGAVGDLRPVRTVGAAAKWPAGVLNLLQGDTAAIEGLCAAGIDRLVYRGNAALGVARSAPSPRRRARPSS